MFALSDRVLAGAMSAALGGAVLTYTYALYPWLARQRRPRLPRSGNAADGRFVSVVIAARAPGADIASKAASLLAENSGHVHEIVVVLDGPDAVARRALEALGVESVVVVELPEWRGKAEALNAGVARARGDILVMTDARQRVDAGAIGRLVAVLGSPDIGAVSGALEIERVSGRATLLDWYWRQERSLRAAEARSDSAIGVSGALYAIKRSCWRPLPSGLLLDDLAVAMSVVRTGMRVAFASEAIVRDVPLGTHRTEFARKVRTLTGNFQYLAWNPWVLNPLSNRIWLEFVSHKLLRLLTPFATALMLIGLLVVIGRSGIVVLLLLGAGAAIAVALRRQSSAAGTIARLGGSALMLQGALIVAAANAVRGRWDVWSDPARPSFRGES